jgi:hypothetical protein
VQRFMFISPSFQHEHRYSSDVIFQLVLDMSTSVDYLSVGHGEMRLVTCFSI